MPRSAHVPVLVALALLLLPPLASAQKETPTQPASPPKVGKPAGQQGSGSRARLSTRVAVGEQAPDFELPRLDGRPLKLSRLRGDWVMLVFVEHRDSLDAIEPMAGALKSIRVRTVAVLYDKTQSVAHHLKGRTPSYVPLADPTGEIVALYGLLDTVREASLPGFVLVNPKGDVRLALLGLELPQEDASRLVEFAVTGE